MRLEGEGCGDRGHGGVLRRGPVPGDLRTAAIGADRAIHVETDEELQPLAVAKLLAALVAKAKRRAW